MSIVTPRIAIIGAGFSGTLVAAQLLRQAQAPLRICLIERDRQRFGRGVAYSTTADCHLLNVPAGNMSAFPEDAEHFFRWAQARQESLVNPPWTTGVTPASFLPRGVYGDYLSEVLDDAERSSASGVCLERKLGTAAGLRIAAPGVLVRLQSGETLPAHRVVLALGNFPPGDPVVDDPRFYESTRYHRDPWAPRVLPTLLSTDSCLLIGSGLTMVDWAMNLSDAGYRGTIHVISRRGLWPHAHRPTTRCDFAIDPTQEPRSVRAWLGRIRDHVTRSQSDWRAIIDALRPANQRLWQSLSVAEQRRFLCHVRPLWDCHRHRLAPQIADRLKALVTSGQLVRHVGRVLGYRENTGGVAVCIRRRSSDRPEALTVSAIVNCSGSESDYRRLDSELVRDLLAQRLIAPDVLGLGLQVAAGGALLSSDGNASPHLFSLGPPQKGMLWETTAVPELRGQTARLASTLLDSLNLRTE